MMFLVSLEDIQVTAKCEIWIHALPSRVRDGSLFCCYNILYTSNAPDNISLIKVAFLKIFYGTPVKLSFLTILFERSKPTLAVALNPVYLLIFIKSTETGVG